MANGVDDTGEANAAIETDDQAYPFITMTRGAFACLLQAPEAGYRWATDLVPAPGQQGVRDAPDGPWLVEIPTANPMNRQYAPLQLPNLHRQFGKTKLSLPAARRFANRYGWLGHHTVGLIHATSSSDTVQLGESWGYWQREIEEMARLLELWDLVRHAELTHHVGLLSRLVRWHGEPYSVFLIRMSQSGRQWLDLIATARRPADHELLARWKPNSLVEPVRYYVYDKVNERMRGHVSPVVLPYWHGEFRMFPDCLLGTLYLLFALELSGQSHAPMICQGCGAYFVPHHGLQRYHDNRCRQRAYHARARADGDHVSR
jgi:hypothetical protein